MSTRTQDRSGEGDRLLRIYLRDHEGASCGGIQLVQRCHRANETTFFGPALATLDAEIRDDQEDLRQILHNLHVTPSRAKRVAAWIGATIGRAKPNGRLFRYSPLSRVLELEALSAAVTAKLSLWITLGDLGKLDPRLDEAKLADLQHRARAQLASLGELHRMAADVAFDEDRSDDEAGHEVGALRTRAAATPSGSGGGSGRAR